MRDIAALVFGGDPGDPGGSRSARDARTPQDTSICDRPQVPDGAWCQTQPGRAALAWLGLSLGAKGRLRSLSRRLEQHHAGRGV